MTTKAQSMQSTQPTGTAPVRNIWWIGLPTIAASVAANLVTWRIVSAVVDIPRDFPPLQPVTLSTFTAIGVGLGALVFLVLHARTKEPTRTFRRVAIGALLLSILPNVALMARPASFPTLGGTTLTYGLLIIFHIVAAAVCIPMLTALARRSAV